MSNKCHKDGRGREMKKLFVLLFFAVSIWGKVLSPVAEIEASGNVIDLVSQEGLLIAGTAAGTLEVYDDKTLELIKKVEFKTIEDFMGETIPPKVFSVDKIKSKEIYLAMMQSPTSYRRFAIVEGDEQKLLISEDDQLMIQKAKFYDEDHILIALLSNEIILYEIATKKEIYRHQLTESHFSDLSFSDDMTLLATADESGRVYILDPKTGERLKTLEGGNVDNIYNIDFHKDRVITAGQDRRSIVYNVNTGSFDRYNTNFLIYACAMSPSQRYGAIAINEENDIGIYDLNSGRELYVLKGQKTTLNSIVFVNENELFSGSDDRYILYWRMP